MESDTASVCVKILDYAHFSDQTQTMGVSSSMKPWKLDSLIAAIWTHFGFYHYVCPYKCTCHATGR